MAIIHERMREKGVCESLTEISLTPNQMQLGMKCFSKVENIVKD